MEEGVDGRFYKAIQSLYGNPVACVEINDMYTDWFEAPFGVKQGDILSPTLFVLFVNDLALQIKKNNLGVCLDDTCLGILLYTDDINLLAESESDFQNMLNLVSSWCHKWRLVINQRYTDNAFYK